MRFKTLLILLLTFFSQAGLATDWQGMARQGTNLRLLGDFEAAKKIEEQLVVAADTPIGHIFALNTIITHLTWDDTREEFNQAILFHTENVLDWCVAKLESDANSAQANHYCGQASFALSLYHGLKGHYVRAGQYGSETIEYLEAALDADPNLTDAKLHLGVAYYVADNLPPFVKVFSRLLWFIPTGNSEKSLPYLIDVIENGDEFPDVARYIYSTLMLQDETTRPVAIEQLRHLVGAYPKNPRFQLRLISVLLMQRDFAATLAQAESYLGYKPEDTDLSLTQIWMLRALLGLGMVDEAHALAEEIQPEAYEQLPSWSLSWHKLSLGQLEDLRGRREFAINIYNEILSMANSDYVNDIIVDAARNGLVTPYRPN